MENLPFERGTTTGSCTTSGV